MGSDVSSEEMSAVEYATVWQAKLAGSEGSATILELSPRPGQKPEFPRLKMWVDSTKHVITKIESYDAAGKKLRTQTRSDFVGYPGTTFVSPHHLDFIDHRRNNHETEMILLDSKIDAGVPDDTFSLRSLQKN